MYETLGLISGITKQNQNSKLLPHSLLYSWDYILNLLFLMPAQTYYTKVLSLDSSGWTAGKSQ